MDRVSTQQAWASEAWGCRAQLAVTAEYTHDMTVVSRLNPDREHF
jgi:hypothetical protein